MAYIYLYYPKILQRILYHFYFLRCRMFPRLLQFFYRIRSIIHRQSQASFYLCYIGSMHFKPILFLNVILNHRICNFFLWSILFCSFCNAVKRNLLFALAKLHFYVDMSLGFKFGHKYYRLILRIFVQVSI